MTPTIGLIHEKRTVSAVTALCEVRTGVASALSNEGSGAFDDGSRHAMTKRSAGQCPTELPRPRLANADQDDGAWMHHMLRRGEVVHAHVRVNPAGDVA
jgi:hypothetical protein